MFFDHILQSLGPLCTPAQELGDRKREQRLLGEDYAPAPKRQVSDRGLSHKGNTASGLLAFDEGAHGLRLIRDVRRLHRLCGASGRVGDAVRIQEAGHD